MNERELHDGAACHGVIAHLAKVADQTASVGNGADVVQLDGEDLDGESRQIEVEEELVLAALNVQLEEIDLPAQTSARAAFGREAR